MFESKLASKDGDRQRAFDRAHAAIERQFTNAKHMNQIVRFSEIAIRAEDSQAIGRSKLAPSLRTSAGARLMVSFETGSSNSNLNRRTDAFARLTHGSIR